MPDQRQIYRDHAEEYDALVDAEDVDGNLPRALADLVPLDGARVIEVGAGTGRITRLLLERGASVVGSDRAPAMLEVARRRLRRWPAERLTLALADAATVEAPPGSFDLAVAGWVFGHFVSWLPDRWREEIAAAIARLDRALRPGGVLAFVETLGTGRETPSPPSDGLATYYAWLEAQGFARRALRTDYRFSSPAEAARLIAFFFGDEQAALLGGRATLPECTGLWSRRRG